MGTEVSDFFFLILLIYIFVIFLVMILHYSGFSKKVFICMTTSGSLCTDLEEVLTEFEVVSNGGR